jgi:hypothetical protein
MAKIMIDFDRPQAKRPWRPKLRIRAVAKKATLQKEENVVTIGIGCAG